MSTLNPAPATLGLASPVVGPWFDDTSLSLPAPDQRLAVACRFTQATAWWPPAGGTLTLAVSTATRPRPLAGLTDADGNPAFGDDRLVALFKLLPEVEERLEALTRILPRPDGVAVQPGQRTRARVRAIAIEFPDRAAARLVPFVNPLGGDAAQAFGLVEQGGNLDNGRVPATRLARPGRFNNQPVDVLANFSSGQDVTLWAFDAEGWAIDPGAVAAWWAALAGGNVAPFNGNTSNLWADSNDPRTCAAANHLALRLVSPHRGAVEAHVLARLNLPPANATPVGGAGTSVYAAGGGAGGVNVVFTAAPTDPDPGDSTLPVDTTPIPLAALLPLGTYAAAPAGSPLTLWRNGAVTLPAHGGGTLTLARDQVEVAVLDAESFACGTLRGPQGQAGTAAQRRSGDQNRASTRINVRRSTLVLQPTLDTVAAAFNALPDGTSPVALVAPAYDHDWGARTLENLPQNPPASLPSTPPALQCFALAGAATAQGATVGVQPVVVRVTVLQAAALAGAWVRIHPQKVNLDTGRREPQPGGAGRLGTVAAGSGDVVAHVLLTLPPGRIGGSTLLGVDVLLFDGSNPLGVYADQRLARPQPEGGTPLALAEVPDTLGADARVLDCDQAVEFPPAAVPPGAVRPGSALVLRVPGADAAQDRFVALDRASVPLPWFDNATLARRLTGADTLAVTSPAFVNEARGNTNPREGDPADVWRTMALNAQVRIQARSAATVPDAGAPLPTQQRLECVGWRNGGTAAGAQHVAVVGAGPALSSWHELLPATAANPTAPAGVDVHGAGVQVTGGITADLAEFMRDRLFPDSADLVADAGANALPVQAVAAPAQWAAVLKTVARGVEGEALAFEALDLADRAVFDAYDTLVAAAAALPGVPALPAAPANVTAALRAACRRVLNALGRQEALFALQAALQRAERLVYIETPALDGEAVDAGGTALAWLDTLLARLRAKPALHVAVCVPRELLPGMPAPLAWVRNAAMQRAVARLLEAGGDRVAVLAPGAGPFGAMRLASTVVVVDDVWALVGTTHLWRRGLSFDSSLAVALFDETSAGSRGAAVGAWRLQLAADRLGVAATQVPVVAHEFVATLRRLLSAGPAVPRLAAGGLPQPPAGEQPTATDEAMWNRDGSTAGDLDLISNWLAQVAGHTVQD